MTRASLADVSTSALERLRDAIANPSLDTPPTRSSLVSFGIRNQLERRSLSSPRSPSPRVDAGGG